MSREMDELEEAEAKECWECGGKLTDTNRHIVVQFGNDAFYCQRCAEKIIDDKWNEGESVKANLDPTSGGR